VTTPGDHRSTDPAPGRSPTVPRAARTVGIIGAAWLAGSIPFSNLAARSRAGVDLRHVGNGTVSGTALYGVAGFGPLAIAGVCDVAKGAVGPVLAGPRRPGLAAVATAAGIAGHNWSPFLRGAGGRGLAMGLGALLVRNWPGTAVLGAGLAAGRLARQTGLGSFVSYVALVPTLAATRGRAGAHMGLAITSMLVIKRLVGNRPPESRTWRAYAERLVFDRDTERRSDTAPWTPATARSA
jgi:acyl phosphate:glycerol-3-phosphate acyltransferase